MTAIQSSVLRTSSALGDDCREDAVSFVVDRDVLRGNLIVPVSPTHMVLFLHGWGGLRNGPHNLLTQLARALARDNVASLRFDFRRRGESDGADNHTTLDAMGDDAVAAATFLRQRFPNCTMHLVGICSGGNIAIGVMDRIPDVAGLFLLSVYPFSDGDSFGRNLNRTRHHVREYWQKLWLPATWKKLIRGEIFFAAIARVLFSHFHARNDTQIENRDDRHTAHLDNLLDRTISIRMIYGDADPDFQASYDYFSTFAETNDVPIDFDVIPHANHNFYSSAWTEQLAQNLRQFVRT